MTRASTPFEQDFGITSERYGDEHRVALRGELDLGSSERVKAELQRAESAHPATVLLDLSELTFIDSTGLRVIIEANSRLQANGSRLALLPGPESVQRVFKLTGTLDQLPFRASEIDAPARAEQ